MNRCTRSLRDRRLIPYKTAHHLKQHVSDFPHPVGSIGLTLFPTGMNTAHSQCSSSHSNGRYAHHSLKMISRACLGIEGALTIYEGAPWRRKPLGRQKRRIFAKSESVADSGNAAMVGQCSTNQLRPFFVGVTTVYYMAALSLSRDRDLSKTDVRTISHRLASEGRPKSRPIFGYFMARPSNEHPQSAFEWLMSRPAVRRRLKLSREVRRVCGVVVKGLELEFGTAHHPVGGAHFGRSRGQFGFTSADEEVARSRGHVGVSSERR